MAEIKVKGMVTIEMTNKDFINLFNPSFSALAQFPTNAKSGKLKYAIKRSLGSVQKMGEAYTNQKTEIFETKAAVNTEGNPKIDDKEQYCFDDPKDRIKALEEVAKLDNKVIKLTIYPVSIKTITDCSVISIGMEINLGNFIIENAELEKQIAQEK